MRVELIFVQLIWVVLEMIEEADGLEMTAAFKSVQFEREANAEIPGVELHAFSKD